MLPLVSSIPHQETSTAEPITHITAEPAVKQPADIAESVETPPSSVSQPQLPNADPSMMESAASDPVLDEDPLSLQLFIVSNEATSASSDPALGHTSNALKRRRSSGVRRTVLAQLQVSSFIIIITDRQTQSQKFLTLPNCTAWGNLKENRCAKGHALLQRCDIVKSCMADL